MMLMVYYLYGLLEVVCVPTTRHKASTAHCGCLIALQQISVRTREATAQQAFAYSIFTHIFCLFSNAINALPQAPSGLGFILDFYTYIKLRPKIRQILSQFFLQFRYCERDGDKFVKHAYVVSDMRDQQILLAVQNYGSASFSRVRPKCITELQ